jgi:hypothetical protein
VRAQQYPVGAVGMPLHDQIFHRHRLAGAAVANLKGLSPDFCARRLKMGDDELALLHHAGRSARPRAECGDRLEMFERAGP